MPLTRWSGMLAAVMYAVVGGVFTLVFANMALALLVPLLVLAAVLLLLGAFTVDLPRAKAKLFAFAVISRGCLLLMLLWGGATAYYWAANGFGDVVFLKILVALFLGYLSGLALESRAQWSNTVHTGS